MSVPFQLSRFYPIVPDADWAARLMALGVKTIQLRAKGIDDAAVKAAIDQTLRLTQRSGCQLIVNDYWKLAIDSGASFIHLGQEDLAAADLKSIRRAGIRIGISTHDDAEREIAIAAGADYIALGPIYETKLKAMRFRPQGLEQIRVWKRKIRAIPLVAIGGITLERADGLIAAGADSVAVITDFVANPNPAARVRQWVEWSKDAPGR